MTSKPLPFEDAQLDAIRLAISTCLLTSGPRNFGIRISDLSGRYLYKIELSGVGVLCLKIYHEGEPRVIFYGGLDGVIYSMEKFAGHLSA